VAVLTSTLILAAFELGLPPAKLAEVVREAYRAQLERLVGWEDADAESARFARSMLAGELEHG
jgi:hypothetical protein